MHQQSLSIPKLLKFFNESKKNKSPQLKDTHQHHHQFTWKVDVNLNSHDTSSFQIVEPEVNS